MFFLILAFEYKTNKQTKKKIQNSTSREYRTYIFYKHEGKALSPFLTMLDTCNPSTWELCFKQNVRYYTWTHSTCACQKTYLTLRDFKSRILITIIRQCAIVHVHDVAHAFLTSPRSHTTLTFLSIYKYIYIYAMSHIWKIVWSQEGTRVTFGAERVCDLLHTLF